MPASLIRCERRLFLLVSLQGRVIGGWKPPLRNDSHPSGVLKQCEPIAATRISAFTVSWPSCERVLTKNFPVGSLDNPRVISA